MAGLSRRTFVYTGSLLPVALTTVPAPAAAAETEPPIRIHEGSLDPWKVPVAELDGRKLAQSLALYTPIWSDNWAVYVADTFARGTGGATGDDTSAESVIVRIPKRSNTASRSEHQTFRAGVHKLDTSILGHRGATIGTSDAGSLFHHPQAHNIIGVPWSGESANKPREPKSMTPVHAHPGIATGSSYRRLFRDPYTGRLYMVSRGTSSQAFVSLWNDELQTFESTARDSNGEPQDGLNDPRKGGAYGHEIAFAPSTTGGESLIYCAPEFFVPYLQCPTANRGFPRRDTGIVLSTDGGRTWTKITNQKEKLGRFAPDTIDVLFPGPDPAPNASKTPGMVNDPSQPGPYDTSRHNGAGAKIAVDISGHPLVFLTWANPDESRTAGDPKQRIPRSLWVARVDPKTGKPTRRVLLAPEGNWDVGRCSVAYNTDGVVAVVVSQSDDISMNHFGTADDMHANYGDNKDGTEWDKKRMRFFLFLTTDGVNWDRYVIDDGSNRISGAYIDPESLRLDGKIRIYPQFGKDVGRAEVWEIDFDPAPRREIPALAAVTPRAEGGPGQITVSWPAAADGGRPVNYAVFSNAGKQWNYVSSGMRAITHTGLPPGKTVTYSVLGFDDKNNWSPAVTVTATAGGREADHRKAPPFKPQAWLRADRILDTAIGDAVSSWSSSGTLELKAERPVGASTDALPRLVDGPAGRTALRFDRSARSRLHLPIEVDSGALTVFVVARLGDADDNHFVIGADGDEAVLGTPKTVTNMYDHQVHLNGQHPGRGASTARERIGAIHRGRWQVLTSRWTAWGTGVRSIATLDNATFIGVDDPTASTAKSALALSIGGVGDTGEFTSQADIAEIVVVNASLGRTDIVRWIDYLAEVHEIDMS